MNGTPASMPLDIARVKRVVDLLVQTQVIDTLLSVMDHGYGEASFKVLVQQGEIKLVTLMETKTVKIDGGSV